MTDFKKYFRIVWSGVSPEYSVFSCSGLRLRGFMPRFMQVTLHMVHHTANPDFNFKILTDLWWQFRNVHSPTTRSFANVSQYKRIHDKASFINNFPVTKRPFPKIFPSQNVLFLKYSRHKTSFSQDVHVTKRPFPKMFTSLNVACPKCSRH